MFRLADPWYLLLMILPVALLAWHFWSHRRGRASLLFSSTTVLEGLPTTWRAAVSPHLHWLRYPALILLVFALARPQSGDFRQEIETFGVDIMLVLDVSGTMSYADVVPNNRRVTRLDVARFVISKFIESRQTDRLGLIAFATHSLTRCPLTVDYDVLMLALEETDLSLFPQDQRSTAVGNAVATGVARLQDSDARSRIIILLTDGKSNAGNIAPLSAAEIAKSEGIRLYTIGFGPQDDAEVDVESLKEMSRITDGKFFRAINADDLQAVYEEIDTLEKSEVKVRNFEMWDELFPTFLWLGCALLLLEVIMSQIVCRRVP